MYQLVIVIEASMDGTKQTVSQKLEDVLFIWNSSHLGKSIWGWKNVSCFPLHPSKLSFFNILIFKGSAGTASQELGLQKASAAEDNEKPVCLKKKI